MNQLIQLQEYYLFSLWDCDATVVGWVVSGGGSTGAGGGGGAIASSPGKGGKASSSRSNWGPRDGADPGPGLLLTLDSSSFLRRLSSQTLKYIKSDLFKPFADCNLFDWLSILSQLETSNQISMNL